MAKIVQCVPNFSEGRRVEVIEAIVSAIESSGEVKVLDYSYDESHNRSVVTFIGEPEAVLEAAFQGARKAAELIDMSVHRGGHPRMGATDVIPFIPILGVKMEDCVKMAKELGKRLADELDIPVYLYEEAASAPERKNLSAVRRGQYEGLTETISRPERKPDFGPARINLKAGATAVGARPPLIAYNINLDTADLEIAGNIARAIRGSSGGFPSIKALGIMIEETGKAQVTINVCDFKKVPLYRVFEMVKREAERYGVLITGSEVIGLVPLEALADTAGFYLQFTGFDRGQVLENRLLG
jgi:glutamate formiminotransferase / 5-formyltetrahydrofolate cyclo-ligase